VDERGRDDDRISQGDSLFDANLSCLDSNLIVNGNDWREDISQLLVFCSTSILNPAQDFTEGKCA
jgi:hypothetical protein